MASLLATLLSGLFITAPAADAEVVARAPEAADAALEAALGVAAPAPEAGALAAAAAPVLAPAVAAPRADAAAAYAARVVSLLDAAARSGQPDRIMLSALGVECPVPREANSGLRSLLEACSGELELFEEPPGRSTWWVRRATPLAGAAAPAGAGFLPAPRVVAPAGAPVAAAAAAEAAFHASVLAYIRKKGAVGPSGVLRVPLNSAAGYCQVPRALKPRFPNIRDFLAAHPAEFAHDGLMLTLKQPKAQRVVAGGVQTAAAAPATAARLMPAALRALEDAFLAEAMTRIRELGAVGVGGELWLKLERVAQESAAWLQLKAHHPTLRAFLRTRPELFRTTDTHVVLLSVQAGVVAAGARPPAPAPSATAAQPPAPRAPAPATSLPLPAASANTLESPSLASMPVRAASLLASMAPPAGAAAASPLSAEEASFRARVVEYINAKGSVAADGERTVLLNSLAGACQMQGALKSRFGNLRAFVAAHPAVFTTHGAFVTLMRQTGQPVAPPAAAVAAVAAPKPLPQPLAPSSTVAQPSGSGGAALRMVEHAFVAEVRSQIRKLGASGPGGELSLALERVAPNSDAWLRLKPHYATLRAFLNAHPELFRASSTHVTALRAHANAALPPAHGAAAHAGPPFAPAAARAAGSAAAAAADGDAPFLAAVVAEMRRVGQKLPNGDVSLLLSQVLLKLGKMPPQLKARHGGLRAFLDAHPTLFQTTHKTATLTAGRAAAPVARSARRAGHAARPRTPPPRPLALQTPAAKKKQHVCEAAFSMPLPWTGGGAELQVRMPRHEDVADALAWLQQDDDVAGGAHEHARLLGVDVETDALCETALVQLSTASRCVLIRWRGLALGAGAAGFEALCRLLEDERWAKCGCELRKDAIDLLFDSGGAARMRNGRDVTPALRRPGAAGERGAVYGLVDAFNMRHGTELKKDKTVTCSDWTLPQLSREQLEYAALDAWLSYRLGASDGGALLAHPETRHINMDARPARLCGALLAAGGLLRECQVCRDASRIPVASAFHQATWKDGKLCIRMASFDNKLRRFDQVEVALAGVAQPWLAIAKHVSGRTATLQADALPRRGADGAIIPQAVFPARAEPEVESITLVSSSDLMARTIHGVLLELASPKGPARFGTAHMLDDAQAAPPPCAPPLLPLTPSWALPWSLNAAQAACVDDIAAGVALTLTLGPPGTGKTTTIAAVAWSLAERTADEAARSVVVLTQQNVAALNVLKALVARYHDVKLVVSKDFYFEWHEHEYDAALEPFIHVTGDLPPESTAPRLLEPRRVTILTFGVAGALADPASPLSEVVDARGVGAVLVDEASQAWSAYALLADAALPRLHRLHLFGDDRQLPPVLSPYDKSALAISAAKHARSMYDAARTSGHAVYALTVQHRMPRELASFISEHVYDGALISAPGMSGSRHAVTWLDVSYGRMFPNRFASKAAPPGGSAGAQRKLAQRCGSSSENEAEVALVDKLLRLLDARKGRAGSAAASCVVLTPYSAQRTLLEKRCSASKANGGRWDVKTVDSFQGREADLVVVSLVRTDALAGFMHDIRRTNVLLSRARHRLYVVGSHDSWARVKDSDLWASFAARFPPAQGCKGLRTHEDLQRALAADKDP